MGLDHGPPNFCQKVWFLIMGTMVIIPIWVLIMYPEEIDFRNSKEAFFFLYYQAVFFQKIEQNSKVFFQKSW